MQRNEPRDVGLERSLIPEENINPLFSPNKHLSTHTIKKNNSIPFKDLAQFTFMVDVLSRKESHHIFLQTSLQQQFQKYLLEAFLLHLQHEHIPISLQNLDLFYFDREEIETNFENCMKWLDTSPNYKIFIISEDDFSKSKQFNILFSHTQCRFIVISNNIKQSFNNFTRIFLDKPSDADIMLILKIQRDELENFHHVLIPEELLKYAYSLAERYLNPEDTLQQALLLLDSSAARTGITDKADHAYSNKPVMTLSHLIHVLSTWTHIPASNLLFHKFKYNEMTHHLQQKIFGQDAAITLISHELHQAHTHLRQKTGPFCSFLFSGPEHTGKVTLAVALTEQLFKQTNILYFMQSSMQTPRSIFDIKLQSYGDRHSISLAELTQQTPYAIIMCENFERASFFLMDQLHEIITTGYLRDENGRLHHFRQMIFILCTTLGSDEIYKIEKSLLLEEETSGMGLLQLVMREQTYEPTSINAYSPQEMSEKIANSLFDSLPISHYLQVIPFLPLNKNSMEKIIHVKLNNLGKSLASKNEIEFSYASEVIRYLVHQLNNKNNSTTDLNKVFKQVYFIVDQTILNQADNKNRSNQLFLQLNDSGQKLRCDWLTTNITSRQHAT